MSKYYLFKKANNTFDGLDFLVLVFRKTPPSVFRAFGFHGRSIFSADF